MEDPRIISALFIFLKMAYYNVLINTLSDIYFLYFSIFIMIGIFAPFFKGRKDTPTTFGALRSCGKPVAPLKEFKRINPF